MSVVSEEALLERIERLEARYARAGLLDPERTPPVPLSELDDGTHAAVLAQLPLRALIRQLNDETVLTRLVDYSQKQPDDPNPVIVARRLLYLARILALRAMLTPELIAELSEEFQKDFNHA